MNAEKIATLDAIARDEFEEYLRTHDMTGMTDVTLTGFMIDPLKPESAYAIVFASKPPNNDVLFKKFRSFDSDFNPCLDMGLEERIRLRVDVALDVLAEFGACACACKRYCDYHAELRKK